MEEKKKNELWIRDARPDDVERLLAIYGYYVENTAVSFEYAVPEKEEFLRRMQKITKRYPYLAAGMGEEILGFAYAGPFIERAAYDWSVELTIYLDPTARGRGLGRKLYEELIGRLKAAGILNLYACIADPETEDEYLTKASVHFHERLGFKTAGRFHKCGFKFGRWYDMVWMERILGEHRSGEGIAPDHFSGKGRK